MGKAPPRAFRFVINGLVVLFAGAALGALLPWLPVLGELGPVLLAQLGPWAAIVPAVCGLLMVRRRRAGRHRGLVFPALAVFATIAGIFMLGRQVAVARANGVAINPWHMLLPHSQHDTRLQPVTTIYGRYAGQDLPLDVYPLIRGPLTRSHAGAAPVLVYIHGGGWGAETLKQRQADYRWFAERGYLVISLEYSLSSGSQHTWDVAQPQLGCALAWVGTNAARLGGDASRLALWGESAGGNLVLNVSYLANQGALKPSCPGTVPHVAATMALYPVIDPARMYHNPDPLVGRFARMMTVNYTGGTPDSHPDRYAAIASGTYISAAAPPTLLIVPQEDHLVDPRAADEFATKARAAGVEVGVIHVPYAEHGFDLVSGNVGNQLIRQAMLRFLLQHGLQP